MAPMAEPLGEGEKGQSNVKRERERASELTSAEDGGNHKRSKGKELLAQGQDDGGHAANQVEENQGPLPSERVHQPRRCQYPGDLRGRGDEGRQVLIVVHSLGEEREVSPMPRERERKEEEN